MLRDHGAGDQIVSWDVHQRNITIGFIAALVSLIWYLLVILVCMLGQVQIWRHYSQPPSSIRLDDRLPHVSIIRPIKGVEPFLYHCLVATFSLNYPKDKLHVSFCVDSREDPSLPILTQIQSAFPHFDVKIFIETDDEELRENPAYGPNPKIRNMRRAYREAIGDVVWIIDCNVWTSRNACARMVTMLQGGHGRPGYRFVHQLPLVVETGSDSPLHWMRSIGGRLEEAFMSSSHAKFYTAINTLLIAPCIVGKSTMFRRTHLAYLTDNQGIDQFAHNICEDHLIGDLLWKGTLPIDFNGVSLRKHAMCYGELAIQPVTRMGASEYWKRRVRWLRVRKFTVILATFVEPGTECFLCSSYGAYAFAKLSHPVLGSDTSEFLTWFLCAWLASVGIWCFSDWLLYCRLQSGSSIEVETRTPSFCYKQLSWLDPKDFLEWVMAWIGRECLALPIWIWAVCGGTTVEWRDRRFTVGLDMKVRELIKKL